MSPGNKDIVRNSSYNSLRVKLCSLKTCRAVTFWHTKTTSAGSSCNEVSGGKENSAAFSVMCPSKWFIPTIYVLKCQLSTNSIELAFRMYLDLFEIPDLKLNFYAGEQKKGNYVVLSGFQSFWDTDFLCARGSFLILIAGYLWQEKPEDVKKTNTKPLLNCWFNHWLFLSFFFSFFFLFFFLMWVIFKNSFCLVNQFSLAIKAGTIATVKNWRASE